MRFLAALSLFVLCACPGEAPPAEDGGTTPAPTTCEAGHFENAAGQCQPAGWTTCGAGFVPSAGGWGCDAVLDGSCDAGSLAVPGEACTAIGWARCPPGFTRDPSGWTCEPTLPIVPCTGATRAAIGSAACQPIGDCGAAFPPAAATLFVDASFGAGMLDATHFATISGALGSAAAGATIAVAPGTYGESLVATRPVKLIGRCAGQVRLSGSPALTVLAVQGVEMEGFTVRDSTLAARVEGGGQLTLRHCVLDANRRSGVQALDPGSRLTLEDVVVRGTLVDPATQTFGQGIAASYSAHVTLTDVELSQNRETGLFLDRAGTTATLTRTLVSGTLPRASTGKLGMGIAVQGGAALDAETLVLQDNRAAGLLVTQPTSRAALVDAVVRRTSLGLDNAGTPMGMAVVVLQGGALSWTGGAAEDAPHGLLMTDNAPSAATLSFVTARGVQGAGSSTFGLSAQGAARLTLEHVAVLSVVGSGVQALSLAEVSLDHVGVFDTTGVGLRAQDAARVRGTAVEVRRHADVAALASRQGSIALTGCVLAEATGTPADGGVAGYGAAVAEAGALTLDRCLLAHNAGAGLYATTRGTAIATSTVVRDTRLDPNGEFGQGVVAERGGWVDLQDVAVVGNHTAGLQAADDTSAISALRVTVRSTLPNALGSRGRGANASFGALLTAKDSAFVDNQQVGLFAFQSRVEVTDSVVRDTRADPDGRFGNGLEALTDGAILFVGGAIEGNAGIGAVFAEAAGVLDGARIAKNPVGLHAQDGSTVEELASAPQPLGARQVVVTQATAFKDNQAKVSAGTVPVPPR
ncbi:MAG: right-handed parallel beta-helix repeat-containing protein [Archangium sp.]|nr:right-handed parallel beta-helix repeat-containing protein [Archangium sp.]